MEVPTEPGRTEDGDGLHDIQMRMVGQYDEEGGDRRDRDEPVQPVHHAAMPGQDIARILDAGPSLEPAFIEIARLRDDREDGGGQRQAQRQAVGLVHHRPRTAMPPRPRR